jgi:cytochrome c oxidase subunit 2
LHVRRRRWVRGGQVAAVAAFAMVALTSCSSTDIEHKLRFGWPTGVTQQATRMRVLWTWSSVAALVVGIMVWGLIFVVLIRDRKKDDEIPKQVKFNGPLEIIYTIVPFLVIAGLFYFTVTTENYVDKLTPNPKSDPHTVVVQVDAFKWNWQFEYLTNDGKTTNYTGTSTPVATVGSSTTIPVLVIPVSTKGDVQKVRFIEHSEDVIHAFWVPEFLFKRDVIPYDTTSTSRDNQFEITATDTGSYVGRCAELCGTYHSQMNFEVRVVSPDVYAKYIAALQKYGPDDQNRQAEALVDAGAGSPCATTTRPFATDRNTRDASALAAPGVCS